MTASTFSRRNAFRLIAGAAVSSVVLGKATLTAIAQATTSAGNIQTVATDLLNLRAGAGLSFDIVDTLPFGTEVTIDASQRKAADGINWIFVTVVETSKTGWVDSSFLSLTAAEASPEAVTASTTGASKWVSVADANLRDGAGLTFDVITTLPVGESVTVTGDSSDADGYTWFPVTVAAGSGWLADIVLTDEQPATTGFELGAAVSVNTDLLNLRQDPGVNTGIIETYAFGATGTIVSASPTVVDTLTWHQVKIDDDGNTGWMAEMFLSSTAATGGPTTGTVTIADGPVNLRTSPSLQADIIASVETGAEATLITQGFSASDGYQWISVRLSDQTGREGWIASEFVTFT
jgi:uncharacterized protein YgiM (DUF1202 family)